TQVSRSIVDGSVNVGVSLLVILVVGMLWAIVGVIIWNVGVAVQQRKGTLTNIGF
ncbi:ABC transporter, partial [Gardnerella vaginalis]